MAVTYDQLLDVILIESGQFIADLSATMLDQNKVEVMIKRELGLYSRYLPNTVTRENRLYNGKIFDKDVDGFVPDAIVSIRTNKFNNFGYLATPMPAPVHNYYWRYDKPTLYFRYPDGDYNYTYIVSHLYDDTDKLISSIELHDKFVNLLVGRFLMTVGKSRRAFTLSDVMISTDADQMISEGKELYDNTLAEIQTNSAFNLAILV